MAARKRRLELSDNWKDGIRVSALMGRLYGHALGDIAMEQSQIKAAQIVLAKLIPDVARQEIANAGGEPFKIAAVEWRVVNPSS